MTLVAGDVLAGPIVRRVEKDLVSVWCALRKPATVSLEVFLGATSAGAGPALDAKATRTATELGKQTLRAGDNLYIVLATFEPATPLSPHQIYSYDLAFDEAGTGVTSSTPRLGNVGLLADSETG